MGGHLGRCDPRAAFYRPMWWCALAVLIVNDHLLKGSGLLPGALTGKLSDFAGLIIAPALLGSLLGVARWRAFAGCAVVITCVFASIKTCPALALGVETLSASVGVRWRVWCDPTDLLALPTLLLGLSCGRVRERASEVHSERLHRPAAIHYAAVFVGSLACLATSMPEPYPPRSVRTDGTRRVYVVGWRGEVHVVAAPTGELLRKVELAPDHGSAWAVGGGWIYGFGKEGLIAHDVVLGRQMFRTRIECENCPAHVVPGDSRVFVLVRHPGDHVRGPAQWAFALDRERGQIAWVRKLPSLMPEDERGVEPVFADGRLLVPTYDGLLDVSAETGDARWMSRASAPRWVAVVDRLVYFGSGDEIFEVPLGDGPELWRFRVSRTEASALPRSALGVSRDRIVYARDRRLTALDRATKQPVWQTKCFELMAVGSEIVLALLDDQILAAFDAKSGVKLWQLRNLGGFELPVIDEDLVIIRARSWATRAYDARTGAQRWALKLDSQ